MKRYFSLVYKIAILLAFSSFMFSCRQDAKPEAEKEYQITFAQPEHGTLVAMCDGNPFSTGMKAKKGKLISFTATPSQGYKLKAWKGTDDDANKKLTATLTVKGDATISVEFEKESPTITSLELPGTLDSEANGFAYLHGQKIKIKVHGKLFDDQAFNLENVNNKAGWQNQGYN